ncbi:hypothetical protein G3I43_32955 [Streptomyces anulatus]|uniref:Uncharacterized protein n=1 Tax=Streptomyces anulatus TaxID=1892 RepID=A0A6G3T2W0_STRAQ|nr:hypothetical protein [Streptomyces anulatus]NEB88938.1 hypothetical protein [Streptomyces anulatus]
MMLNTTRLSDGLPTLEEAAHYRAVLVLPPDQRDAAARVLVARQRREQAPGRRTWEAKDSLLPSPDGLIAVLDNKGDLWRSIPGTDAWREVPRPGPSSNQGTSVPLPWPEFLQKHAPASEPPGEWTQQRTDVMDALRATHVELNRLLAGTADCSSAGTGAPSVAEADEDDDDLLDRARSWAARLTGAADRLHAAVGAAALLHDEVITELAGAFSDSELSESRVMRGPNGEVSIRLSPSDADLLAGMMAVSSTLMPMNLHHVGVKPSGWFSGPRSTTMYLTDDGGRLLTKLLRGHRS